MTPIQLVPQPPQPYTATPLTTLYTSKINIDSNNFAPRIGLAWQLGKGKVLRSGYGIFYAKTPGSTFYAQRVENGVYQQTFVCTSLLPIARRLPHFPERHFFAARGPPMQAPFASALTPTVTSFTPPTRHQPGSRAVARLRRSSGPRRGRDVRNATAAHEYEA